MLTPRGSRPSSKDRFRFFSINLGKADMTARGAGLDWRKLESIGLGKGRGLLKRDEVGVVTSWTWTTAEQAGSEITAQRRVDIQNAIRGKEVRKKLAGQRLGTQGGGLALRPDISIDAVKRKVGRLVKLLIEDGTLIVVQRRDPTKRSIKEFVEAPE